jgi:hypothetical protein
MATSQPLMNYLPLACLACGFAIVRIRGASFNPRFGFFPITVTELKVWAFRFAFHSIGI